MTPDVGDVLPWLAEIIGARARVRRDILVGTVHFEPRRGQWRSAIGPRHA